MKSGQPHRRAAAERHGYFAKWADEGVFTQFNGLLRQLLREKEGRDAEPSACVIDAQSVKTSTSVPATGQGIDAGKEIVGRKRSIVTDTLGLLVAVLVTAASVQDSIAGTRLLDRVAADHPGIRKVWVDGGYRQHLVEHAAALRIDMEITGRKPGSRGSTPIPKRWAVERTYGWLMLHRRLARDYETLSTRSEAIIHIAMTDLMARRLTGENTIAWRDPTPQTNHQIPG
ncbi:IS5 family transposase [Streptomyces sp. DH41]|nr:IS5 family transposase [Streptomyces sp. DH41]MDG9722067.1 IS5 family transposase [Streptomyces sp. DH41]